jgi:hypothetical protein
MSLSGPSRTIVVEPVKTAKPAAAPPPPPAKVPAKA